MFDFLKKDRYNTPGSVFNNRTGSVFILNDESVFLQLLILLLLVCLNAFFASSEVALISLKPTVRRRLLSRGGMRARALKALTDDSGRFLATVQIGVTLAGFLASAFAANAFSDPLTELLESLGITWISHGTLDKIVVVFITILLSYFSLVFGELIPKQIGLRYTEFMAWHVALPIHFLAVLARPFVSFLNLSVETGMRLFGRTPPQTEGVTEEDIRSLLEIGREQGVISEEKKELLENVFAFSTRTAAEIMTHRTEITAVAIADPPDKIDHLFQNAHFSRIPVYRGDLDDIVGLVHLRDYFTLRDRDKAPPSLSSIMKPVYLVPETIRADRLFREMKNGKTGMAVLLDEFGGTAGIVTDGDLVAEIVGSFGSDPHLQAELEQLSDHSWRVDSAIRLTRLRRELRLTLPETTRYDTLGGFLMMRFGMVPEAGTVLDLPEHRISLQVETIRNHHIDKVILRRTGGTESPENHQRPE